MWYREISAYPEAKSYVLVGPKWGRERQAIYFGVRRGQLFASFGVIPTVIDTTVWRRAAPPSDVRAFADELLRRDPWYGEDERISLGLR